MVQGVDVFARYQGTINWSQVKNAGVSMMFTKLTNGNSVASPAGDSYIKGARGQKILVGGYHYALSGSAVAQADRFAAELLRLNALDLAPALDFEDNSLPTSAASRRIWITQFFTELKKKITWLSKVLIYSSALELTAIAAGTLRGAVPGLTILVWDAEYGPNDGSEHPVRHYTGAYAIHQYTSTGHVPGIVGAVDRDDIVADVTEPHPGATPTQEDDMPTVQELLDANVTYKSRVDGTTKSGKFSDALGDMLDMHDQYSKGYGGIGAAGPMALEIVNTYTTVNNLSTALKAMSDLIAAGNADLSANDVYNAVVKALQENTVKVDVSVTGSTTDTPPATPPTSA